MMFEYRYMLKKITRNIAILLIPFFLSSCIETVAVSTFSSVYLLKKDSLKKSLSDTKILSNITRKLTFNSKRSDYSNLYINVDRGRVLISGYAKNKEEYLKVEQLGKLIIGNNVEIGANCTLDRGALADTEIHDGIILDNQIQIAHNVILGKNSAIAASISLVSYM